MRCCVVEEHIERQLRDAALGLGAEDCMALPAVSIQVGLLYQSLYLSGACHTKRSHQPISPFSSFLTQHTFDKMQSTGALEKLALTDILLENLREGKSLDSTLPVVAGWWFNGNMRGCSAFYILDVKEAFAVDGGRRAKAEVDFEQRRAGSLMIHVCVVLSVV